MGLVNNIFKKLADTYFPVGTIYITKSKTNPGTIVGGTWELKHRFKTSQYWVNNPNNCFTFNSTNVSSGTFLVSYLENSAQISCTYVPKVAINDTGYAIGTISTTIGGPFYANPCIIGRSTSYSYIILANCGAGGSSGASLFASDCIVSTGAASYSTGSSVRMYFPLLLYDVPDSFCNEWHWVRTA